MSKNISKSKIYSEKMVAEIMEKLVRAIAHCHENGVCHRDLKPDNILIDKNLEVKVIDFGLSKHLDTNIRSLKSRVGTPAYMAPEVILGNTYDLKCDVWSLGVLMYTLLTGTIPFLEKTLDETLNQIIHGRCNYNLPIFRQTSKEAVDLLKGMLNTNPIDRLDAHNTLLHPWFN